MLGGQGTGQHPKATGRAFPTSHQKHMILYGTGQNYCVSCLIEDTTEVCLYAYLFLCANNHYLQQVCMLMHRDLVHSSRLYT